MLSRYITAFVLLGFLFFIAKMPPWVIVLVAEVIVFIAVFEWSKICKMSEIKQGITASLFLLLSVFIVSANIGLFNTLGFFGVFKIFKLFNAENVIILQKILIYGGLLFWLSLAPYALYKKSKIVVGVKSIFIGSFMGASAIAAFVYLIDISGYYVLIALLIPIVADVFAYFVGRLIGSTKLTIISPKKTVEGVIGGLVMVTIIGVVAMIYFVNFNWFLSVLIAVLVGIASVIGDLYISLGKRWSGKKNTGSILPGHGGILDRFDSHFAALPVFAGLVAIF